MGAARIADYFRKRLRMPINASMPSPSQAALGSGTTLPLGPRMMELISSFVSARL